MKRISAAMIPVNDLILKLKFAQ